MTDDKPPAKRRGRPPGSPRVPGSGRKPGTPNKDTVDLRKAVTLLVEGNLPHAQEWLDKLAKQHPGRALAVLVSLCDFALPRLRSIEANVNTTALVAHASVGVTRETAMEA